MSNRFSAFTPSLAGLLLGLVLLYAFSLPLLSGDLGWQIEVGRYILDHGEVPRVNFLSYTAAWYPWLVHEWGACLIFRLLDMAGGLRTLLLFRGLLFVCTLLGLYALGRRLKAEPLALAGLVFFAAITLALNVAMRPWQFTNFLLMLELLLAQRLYEQPDKSYLWWLFVPLLGFWINLHGGFEAGLIYLEVAWLYWYFLPREKAKGMSRASRAGAGFALSAALFLVLILNPYGTEALLLPVLYLTGDSSSGLGLTSEIREWAPLDLGSFFGRIYFIWWGLTIASAVASREIRRRPEFYMGLAFLLLTLRSQRHFPLAAIFLLPVIARGLLAPLRKKLEGWSHPKATFFRELSQQEAIPRAPFFALLLFFGTLAYGFAVGGPDFEKGRLEAKAYPLEAVAALRDLPPGRLFNHYDWAGLIAWKAPEHKLFITPANDAYPRSLFEDWLAITNMKSDWRRKLDQYRVDTVLMPASSSLVLTLQQEAGWKVIYADEEATLIRRRALLRDD